MVDTRFKKRDLLKMAAGMTAGFLVGGRVWGQDEKLFGIKLPKQLMSAIPKQPLAAARMVSSLLDLERQADIKGLPKSLLALKSGQPIITSEASVYLQIMPRLVALIDRSELQDLGLADQAGALLSELHQSQHEVPEFYQSVDFDPGIPGISAKNNAFPGLGIVPSQTALPSAALDPDIDLPTAPAPVESLPTVPGLPESALPESSEPPVPIEQIPNPPSKKWDPNTPISRRRDFASLRDEYRLLFDSTELRPEYSEAANWHVSMIRKSRPRYEQLGKELSIPWYFIGITHALEASFNFRAHLHNGDFPLTARTRQVPSGRPVVWLPPADWGSSAKDAMTLLGFTRQKDWSLERTLYRFEAYNGLGYRSYGVPTPYLWSFSNHYDRGKFVADGKWSTKAKSQQCGSAIMLKLLQDAGEVDF